MPRQTIYTQDSDLDGLTDAQEMALGTNPLSPDSDGDGQADLVEILSGRQATVDEMRQVLQAFMKQSYESYVKALFAVEHQITSESLLNDLYYFYYRAEDNIGLLDEHLVQEIERHEAIIKDDLANLFEKLYGFGEGNEFIQDVLDGQTSKELVSPQSWNLGSYDHYSLETLDDLILNQLPNDSTDYFDDLVQLAIRQNKLDSKAQFLEAYLADSAYREELARQDEPLNQVYKDYILDYRYSEAQIFLDSNQQEVLVEVSYTVTYVANLEKKEQAQINQVEKRLLRLGYSKVGDKLLVNHIQSYSTPLDELLNQAKVNSPQSTSAVPDLPVSTTQL